MKAARLADRFQLKTCEHVQHSKAGQEHERKGSKGSSPLSSAAAKMGTLGGPARARKLSAQRRREIASMGARAKNKGTSRQRKKGTSTGGSGDTGGLVASS